MYAFFSALASAPFCLPSSECNRPLFFLQIDMIEDSDATTANHEQLTTQGREPGSIRNISIWDIARPFRVQIVGGENFSVGNVESLYVEMGL